MANNPYVNKVQKADGTVLMDISDTTASTGDVMGGKVFYTASGQRSTGTLDISGKADKVSGATSGNFAALDENGNLTDSGSKASDFLTEHQDISGKLDKPATIVNDKFIKIDSNGNVVCGDAATQEQITTAVDGWLEDNVDPETGYVLDRTLSMSNAATPADITGSLKSALSELPYVGNQFIVPANTSHSSNSDRVPVDIKQGEKYLVFVDFKSQAGQIWAHYTDGTTASISASGTASKSIDSIGIFLNNTSSEEKLIQFVVIKNPIGLDLYELQTKTVPDLSSLFNYTFDAIGNTVYNWDLNTTRDYPTPLTQNSYANWASVIVPCFEGDLFSVKGSGGNNSKLWMFVNSSGTVLEPYAPSQLKTNNYIQIVAPANAAYIVCNTRTNDSSYPVWGLVKGKLIQKGISDNADQINKIKSNVVNPVLPSLGITWRNGSAFNNGNVNFISPTNIMPVMGADKAVFYADVPLSTGESVLFYLCTFTIDSGVVSTDGSSHRKRTDVEIISDKKYAVFDFVNGDVGFAIYITKVDSNGDKVPLRIATTDTTKLSIARYYNDKTDYEVKSEITSARQIPGRENIIKPLTILHFSDIHADSAALDRIIGKSKAYSNFIDEKICTGDIVANSYGSIAGWWNPEVLTCIGNHDTASYSSGTYNWTYLTMTQRDEYYIAPFESNWNLPEGAHTSGTSYYYKDYDDSKVRMIVIDSMLYTGDTTATEAAAQTAWLAELMADTLDDQDDAYGYHVLIAIHSPHGGSTPVECTFTQENLGTMPTYSDCNTPDAIINAVATAITNGMHFIGYICGHTHWDAIYKATQDGSQLMYCITCANVASANQWKNSDQGRNADADAFNLVTIDTVNSLVKIVRGGGANIDRNMRSRKAICFNYSTGQKVHEVL